jgi:WhiB family transcriptional regulator, redox-sensing transcriptional regulator
MNLPTPRPEQRSVHPSKRAALVRRIEVGWQDRALCRKFPADDWFPAPFDSAALAQAVEVCLRCPVRISCLAAALAMGEQHGVWGGATEADRCVDLATLARGASVPDVLDELLVSGQPTDEQERGEAA